MSTFDKITPCLAMFIYSKPETHLISIFLSFCSSTCWKVCSFQISEIFLISIQWRSIGRSYSCISALVFLSDFLNLPVWKSSVRYYNLFNNLKQLHMSKISKNKTNKKTGNMQGALNSSSSFVVQKWGSKVWDTVSVGLQTIGINCHSLVELEKAFQKAWRTMISAKWNNLFCCKTCKIKQQNSKNIIPACLSKSWVHLIFLPLG